MEEKKLQQIKRDILDAYFLSRLPLPEEGAVQQNRSTQDILDELEPMGAVTKDDVLEYLAGNDFHPTTERDGTVVWAIWRKNM